MTHYDHLLELHELAVREAQQSVTAPTGGAFPSRHRRARSSVGVV